MALNLDQFSQDLRLKLANVQSNLKSLKTEIDAKAATAEHDVRKHLDSVSKQIDQRAARAATAKTEMKKWVDEKNAATTEKIAEWKTKHETAKLQNRADGAEAYARAACDVALAAVDEAEKATLEAWLARRNVSSVVHV